MVQINQELGRKHWATHLSVRSFAHIASQRSCTPLHWIVHWLTQFLTPELMGKEFWCPKIKLFWTIVHQKEGLWEWIEGAMSPVKGPKAKLRDLETWLKWKSSKQETLRWSFGIWIGLSALKSGPLVGRQGPPFRRQGRGCHMPMRGNISTDRHNFTRMMIPMPLSFSSSLQVAPVICSRFSLFVFQIL